MSYSARLSPPTEETVHGLPSASNLPNLQPIYLRVNGRQRPGATRRGIQVRGTTDRIRMNPPGKAPEIDIHDRIVRSERGRGATWNVLASASET